MVGVHCKDEKDASQDDATITAVDMASVFVCAHVAKSNQLW